MRSTKRRFRSLFVENLEERRVLTFGQLDPTFGTNGLIHEDIAGLGKIEHIGEVAIDSLERVVVVGTLEDPQSFGKSEAFIARYLNTGERDLSFGDNGISIISLAGLFPGNANGLTRDATIASGVVIGDHDQITVVGSVAYNYFSQGIESSIFALRLDDAGALDPTFGTNGIAQYVSGLLSNGYIRSTRASDVVIHGNSLFVAGTTDVLPSPQDMPVPTMTVLQLNLSDGSVVSAFGNNGFAIASPTLAPNTFPESAQGNRVQVDHQGRIVVSGSIGQESPLGITVARFTSSGSLDLDFSDDGVASSELNLAEQTRSLRGSSGLAIANDDSIYLATSVLDFSTFVQGLGLLKVSDTGETDANFGEQGLVTIFADPFPGTGQIFRLGAFASDLIMAPDGRLLLAGGATGHDSTLPGSPRKQLITVASLLSDGSFDESFSDDGLQFVEIPNRTSQIERSSLVLQNDGRVVVAAVAQASFAVDDLAIARLLAGSNSVSISSPVNTISEAGGATYQVIISRTGSYLGPQTVLLTSSGTARLQNVDPFDRFADLQLAGAGLDSADRLSVHFETGQESVTLTLSPFNDVDIEEDETFNLALDATPIDVPYSVNPNQAFAEWTITSDDGTSVEIVASPTLIDKSSGGTVHFQLIRKGTYTGPLVVSFEIRGTATRWVQNVGDAFVPPPQPINTIAARGLVMEGETLFSNRAAAIASGGGGGGGGGGFGLGGTGNGGGGAGVGLGGIAGGGLLGNAVLTAPVQALAGGATTTEPTNIDVKFVNSLDFILDETIRVGQFLLRDGQLTANLDMVVVPSNVDGTNENVQIILDRPASGSPYIVGKRANANTIIRANFSDNHAPVFFATLSHVSPVNFQEDQRRPNGIPVSSLLASYVTDQDLLASSGVALVGGSDSTAGTWQYTVDGFTWNALHTLSESAAIPLASDGTRTQVRFVPRADFSGNVSLLVRAWDQTTSFEGVPVDLTAPGSTGGKTAFSADVHTISFVVQAINDAPELDATRTNDLTPILEDRGPGNGTAIARMVGAGIKDPDAGARKGIAIIGITGVTSGVWQYTLDGTNWTNVGSVSPTAALLLPVDGTLSRVRYIPNENFSGNVRLSYVAWDGTSGIATSRFNTVRERGGDRAFSAGRATANLTVIAVNDAPKLQTLEPISLTPVERNSTPTGYYISSTISPMITDIDRGRLKGIAVVEVSPNGLGTWQYSIDRGRTWSELSNVSETAARLIASQGFQSLLRFLPNGSATGSASLRFRAWDQTIGTNGQLAPAFPTGGKEAFSDEVGLVTVNIV